VCRHAREMRRRARQSGERCQSTRDAYSVSTACVSADTTLIVTGHTAGTKVFKHRERRESQGYQGRILCDPCGSLRPLCLKTLMRAAVTAPDGCERIARGMPQNTGAAGRGSRSSWVVRGKNHSFELLRPKTCRPRAGYLDGDRAIAHRLQFLNFRPARNDAGVAE